MTFRQFLQQFFSSMAKNATKDAERLQQLKSINRQLDATASRIEANNKELAAADDRLAAAIDRLIEITNRRRHKRKPSAGADPEPHP